MYRLTTDDSIRRLEEQLRRAGIHEIVNFAALPIRVPRFLLRLYADARGPDFLLIDRRNERFRLERLFACVHAVTYRLSGDGA